MLSIGAALRRRKLLGHRSQLLERKADRYEQRQGLNGDLNYLNSVHTIRPKQKKMHSPQRHGDEKGTKGVGENGNSATRQFSPSPFLTFPDSSSLRPLCLSASVVSLSLSQLPALLL